MFESEKRKVALIIDNCPAHLIIDNLSHICEPAEGSRHNKKANYRKRLVKLILRSFDSNKLLPKVSLLTALQLLTSAWNEVSQATIVNCFKKAKISDKHQTIAINDEDDPSKRLTRISRSCEKKIHI